jgi:hypothetical protein
MKKTKNETPNAQEQRPAFAFDTRDLQPQAKSLTTAKNAGKRDLRPQIKSLLSYPHDVDAFESYALEAQAHFELEFESHRCA